MKTIKSLFLLAAFLMSSFNLIAQDTQQTFFIVEMMKSTPGKTDEYVRAEREGSYLILHDNSTNNIK